MASYHRVLELFGRSVHDKSVECNYDIHPWEVLINDESWAGKTRLVGFVDVFFLICYSAESRFEKGIIIYKDDEVIRNMVDANDVKLDVVNQKEVDKDKEKVPRRYFKFQSRPVDYVITSLGHEIGLKTKYPKSSLMKYEIKLFKSKNAVMKKRIKRGINQHSLVSLVYDAIRLGIVTNAEMVGQVLAYLYVGSSLDDSTRKYLEALGSVNSMALSNEAT
ncbi:hypothetical protein F4809DRAFT_621691 [Biscogniauxia mediterranea]|nr:hypothetical protein F4809DRAFT_621691 [Biscogniauxia mediterranea]